MKDAESAELKEKSYFRFFQFLFIFHSFQQIENHPQNRIKAGGEGGGICISLIGKYSDNTRSHTFIA